MARFCSYLCSYPEHLFLEATVRTCTPSSAIRRLPRQPWVCGVACTLILAETHSGPVADPLDGL